MQNQEKRLLRQALEQLAHFQGDTITRLTRMEENLRQLHRELMGDGQPGRLARLEEVVDRLRTEHNHQRGLLAVLSAIISTAVAFVIHLFDSR